MTAAVRPTLTSRPAVLKNSDVILVPEKTSSSFTRPSVIAQKPKPKPRQSTMPIDSGSGALPAKNDCAREGARRAKETDHALWVAGRSRSARAEMDWARKRATSATTGLFALVLGGHIGRWVPIPVIEPPASHGARSLIQILVIVR